jgi:hypothetical protein
MIINLIMCALCFGISLLFIKEDRVISFISLVLGFINGVFFVEKLKDIYDSQD